jgi:uncharacterized protein (DUF983 family)
MSYKDNPAFIKIMEKEYLKKMGSCPHKGETRHWTGSNIPACSVCGKEYSANISHYNVNQGYGSSGTIHCEGTHP